MTIIMKIWTQLFDYSMLLRDFYTSYIRNGGVVTRLPLTTEQREEVNIEAEKVLILCMNFENQCTRVNALLKAAAKLHNSITRLVHKEDSKEASDKAMEEYNQIMEEVYAEWKKANELFEQAVLEQENFRMYLGSLDDGRMEERIREIR